MAVPASRTCSTLASRALLAVVPLSTIGAVRAQLPALAPTTSTSIVVNGTLHYSSILVPVGVTVRFVVPAGSLPPRPPAVVLCDGDAIVHGTLSVAGDVHSVSPFPYAAGSVTTGQGVSGSWCLGLSLFTAPRGGLHAGTYGSVLPFSLAGGSPGGTLSIYSDSHCLQHTSDTPGSEGGGTLVLRAGGAIEVDGTVTADGATCGGGRAGAAAGSGGSILLRGDAGVTVLPSGTVTARGGAAFPWGPLIQLPPTSLGAPGYVRLDAWGMPPRIQGRIAPAPTVLELPHLRALSQPRIGTTWTCDVFAPEAAPVFVAASPTPGNGTQTPFGPLGIDLPSATILAYAALASPSHDPFVSVSTSIPNSQTLVGLAVWIQALVMPPALAGRLSNTLAVVVQ
jgi:hypothetical protein